MRCIQRLRAKWAPKTSCPLASRPSSWASYPSCAASCSPPSSRRPPTHFHPRSSPIPSSRLCRRAIRPSRRRPNEWLRRPNARLRRPRGRACATPSRSSSVPFASTTWAQCQIPIGMPPRIRATLTKTTQRERRKTEETWLATAGGLLSMLVISLEKPCSYISCIRFFQSRGGYLAMHARCNQISVPRTFYQNE